MYPIIHLIFTLFTFILSLLDTYFYQGFCQKHFHISADLILIIYLSLSFVLSALKVNLYPQFFAKINNKIFFPTLMLAYLTVLFLEKHFYPNFVFSTFHLHRLMFLNLLIISGSIFYITFPKFKNKINQIIYLLLPLIIIFCYVLFLFFPTRLHPIIKEDGIFESLQFIFYFISLIFSFKTFLYFKKIPKHKIHTLFFLLLSIGLFFIAGEEISWGQRIIGFQTPENYAVINAQKETTLHNLNSIQNSFLHLSFIGVGLYGLTSNFIIRKFFPKIYSKYSQLTMPFHLIFCFFVLLSYYILDDYFQFMYLLTSGRRANFILAEEIAETYLSLAMTIYTTQIFLKRHQTKA